MCLFLTGKDSYRAQSVFWKRRNVHQKWGQWENLRKARENRPTVQEDALKRCVCLFFWQTRCFLTGQMDATECVWWISLRLSLRSQSGLHRLHRSKPPRVSGQHAEEQPPVCENPPAVTRAPLLLPAASLSSFQNPF